MRPSNPPRQLLFSLLVLASLSCDQSFDPRVASEPLPIIYSVLATDKSQQFVRIYTQYDSSASVPGSEAIEIPITDALVTLNDGANTIVLSDTLLTRPPDPRYQTPIHAYVASGLAPEFGGRYTLQVQSSTVGFATSVVTIPEHPIMYLTNDQILDYPHDHKSEERATVLVYLQPGAKAYILRLIVRYEILGQNGWEQQRHEIPVSFYQRPFKYDQAIYGQLTRLGGILSVIQFYTNEAYRLMLSEVASQTTPNKLVFHSVVLQFVQFDEHLYNYYSIASGFQDRYSLRLDHATYSNISGGTGLFGAYAVDSLEHALPYDFIYNRR